MSRSKPCNIKRTRKFFRIALSHATIEAYYKTNFQLMQHHKYSLTELEDMLPWEREVYITLLIQHMEDEEQRRKNR